MHIMYTDLSVTSRSNSLAHELIHNRNNYFWYCFGDRFPERAREDDRPHARRNDKTRAAVDQYLERRRKTLKTTRAGSGYRACNVSLIDTENRET